MRNADDICTYVVYTFVKSMFCWISYLSLNGLCGSHILKLVCDAIINFEYQISPCVQVSTLLREISWDMAKNPKQPRFKFWFMCTGP
jgi:hypothetical protein